MNEANTEITNRNLRYDDPEAEEWVLRAITDLTALEQKVLALFYSCEFTINEIAERVNLSPAGVRNTLACARNPIRIRVKRFANGAGATLPETVPASALSTVINERMEPLLMEIRHDEELRKQAELIRQEEQRRLEEQKLSAATQFYPGLEASGAKEQPRVVIYGSPYERDRRRAELGAMAAGTEVPEAKKQIPDVPPIWQEEPQADTSEELPKAENIEDDEPKGGSRKIVLIALICVLVLILGFAGYRILTGGAGTGGDAGGQGTDASDGSGEEQAEMTEAEKLEAARKEAAKAYLTVLEDNEGNIINSTQYNGSYDSVVSRPAALVDIDGDGIRELFLLTMSTMGVEGNELHIYSFADGEVKELDYRYLGAEGFAHYEVAGGGNFAVYRGKEPGTLYIYQYMVDDGMTYSLVKYSFDGGRELRTENELTNWYWNHGDPNTTVDDYKENGVSISIAEGGDKFSAAFSDCGKGILFSAAKGTEEVSLWNYFNISEAAAMPYPDLKAALEGIK